MGLPNLGNSLASCSRVSEASRLRPRLQDSGLLLNIVGATIALSPRFLRGYVLINERLDTLLARWGLAFLAIGFFQQLVGNVIG